MPASPFWYDDPESWGRVVFGGIRLPGICDIDGIKVGNRWDIKEAPGTDGATETYKGYTPASFIVVVRMWEPQHWAEIQTAISTIRPRPGKATPSAFDVIHPKLAPFGIKSAIVMDLALDGPGDDGTGTLRISCREYFAPPKKSTTGTANSSTGGPGYAEKKAKEADLIATAIEQDKQNAMIEAAKRSPPPLLPGFARDVPEGATIVDEI